MNLREVNYPMMRFDHFRPEKSVCEAMSHIVYDRPVPAIAALAR